MRCDIAREMLAEEPAASPEAQSHLASCDACSEYARGWELIHRGLVVLREQAPPEPSAGFAIRLMHRIKHTAAEVPVAQLFLAQVGKRVVFATLLMALMLLLGLVLPSSGPFRSPGVSETVLSQPQIAALPSDQIVTDQIIGVDASDFPDSGQIKSDVQESKGSK